MTEGIEFLENATGRRFGDRRRPLWIGCVPGAARSMPGMLDNCAVTFGCSATAARGLVRIYRPLSLCRRLPAAFSR